MHNRTDAELLRNYATTRSEAAFGEIVRRYADVVYSAALRQVGDAETARDVTQTVFVDLARKAGTIPESSLLIGWLHRGARFAALEQLRKDHRRRQRERTAAELPDADPGTPDDWTTVRPVLDEAIASLGSEDRDALLLRYFKNESFSSVGTALGVSEAAAQKRVARALERLREFLAGRGITTTAAALTVVLTAKVVQAAPAGFAAALAAAALANSPIAVPVSKLLPVSKVATLAAIIALTGGLVALIAVNQNKERELRAARATIAGYSSDADAFRIAREQLVGLSNEFARLQAETRELPRLRGDVARLRRELAESPAGATRSNTPTNQPPDRAPPQVLIEGKVSTVPADELGSVADGSILLMDELQIKALQSPGLKSVGEPQINVRCGEMGRLFIGQQIPMLNSPTGTGFAYTNIGVTVEVKPVCGEDLQGLDLKFNLTLADMVQLPAEDRPPGFESTPALQSMSFSNQMTLAIGQSLVFREKMPDGSWARSLEVEGPQSLLVIITPTQIGGPANQDANVARTGRGGADGSESALPPTSPTAPP